MGRPVTGDIGYQYASRSEQWPDEQFLPLLDAVLNAPGVESVKWHQYTPSFNDGDPCTFSLGEIGVRLTDTDEDSEEGVYEDGYIGTYNISVGQGSWPNYTRKPKPGFEELFPALEKLENGIGHFEILLETTFGNGSEIVATLDGFKVGYYDHD